MRPEMDRGKIFWRRRSLSFANRCGIHPIGFFLKFSRAEKRRPVMMTNERKTGMGRKRSIRRQRRKKSIFLHLFLDPSGD
jgi:hypothetical protein